MSSFQVSGGAVGIEIQIRVQVNEQTADLDKAQEVLTSTYGRAIAEITERIERYNQPRSDASSSVNRAEPKIPGPPPPIKREGDDE